MCQAIEMNRRSFLKRSSTTLLALAAVSLLPAFTAGCSTSWITTAEKDLPVISAILTSTLGIVADATGNAALDAVGQAALNVAINAASAGLVTLSSLVTDYNASPSASVLVKITAALTDVQQNLNGILSAAQIKDTALQTAIAGGIGVAISVVSSIELLIPSSAVSAKSAAIGVKPVKIEVSTPAEIKARYNAIVLASGYTKHTI